MNHTKTESQAARLTGLDAVRGVACFSVLLYHCLYAAPPALLEPVQNSPFMFLLRIVTNGQAAVIVFFWLSGYVLALPYMRGAHPGYGHFLLKRVCRLYVPFAAAVGLAALAYRILGVRPGIAAASPLIDLQFEHVRHASLGGHFLMTGRSQDLYLDIVIWTLVHEMRISLIFPLLVLLCRRTWAAVIVALMGLIVSSSVLNSLGATEPWKVDSFGISLLWTMRFVPHFLGGILLCRHSEHIRARLRRMSPGKRLAILFFALAVFSVPHNFAVLLFDGIYAFSAATIVMLSFDTAMLHHILGSRILQRMGRISYSVYLIHVPVLLVLCFLLSGSVPYPLIGLAAIPAALAAASLLYAGVELPAMKLGRRRGGRGEYAAREKSAG